MDVERRARLDQGRNPEVDGHAALCEIRLERDHTVTQRRLEDFLRVQRADKRHAHVSRAFEIRRQRDLLNAARGIRLEPRVGMDAVALDRDEAAACVGGADAHLHRVARIVFGFVELDLQLRIPVQRAGQFSRADHAEPDARDAGTVAVPDFVNKVTGAFCRHRPDKTVRRNGHRRAADFLEFLDRLVAVVSVRFFDEHREVAALDQAAFEIFQRDLFEGRIHGEERNRAGAAGLDEIQIAVAFVPDQPRLRGDQRRGLAGHAAAAIPLERLRVVVQLPCGFGEFLEAEWNLRLAVIAGGLFGDLDVLLARIFFLIQQAVVKLVAGVFVKGKPGGREGERAGDPPPARGLAVKVLEVQQRAEVVGRDPALVGRLAELGLQLHPVGLEFLDRKSGPAKPDVAVSVLHEIHIEIIPPGRRLVLGVEVDRGKRVARQGQALFQNRLSAGIDDLDLERKAVEIALPVPLFHRKGEVDSVARTVDAALAEREGIEGFGVDIADAADVEPRKIQLAILAVIREEGNVVAEPRDECHRPLLAAVVGQLRKRHMPVLPGHSSGQRNAVFSEKVHAHPRSRDPGFDRNDIDVNAACRVELGEQPQVRHEDETRRDFRSLDFVRLRVPSFCAQKEKPAHGASIGGNREVRGKIERRVICRKPAAHRDRLLFLREHGDIFRIERSVEKFRVLKISFGLADEVVDLVGADAGDLVVDAGDAARFHREFSLAAQREEPALTLKSQLLRRFWHGQDVVVVGLQRIPAERLDALFDQDIKLATLLEFEFERDLGGARTPRRNEGDRDFCRFGKDLRRDLARAAPRIHARGTRWQKEQLQRRGNRLGFDLCRALNEQDLLRLAIVFAGDVAGKGFDAEEVVQVRHFHFGNRRVPHLVAAICRVQAPRQREPGKIFLRRQAQRRTAQIDRPVVQPVFDREPRLPGGKNIRPAQHLDRRAGFQVAAPDRMREFQCRDQLPDGGIFRVLIKCELADRPGEFRRRDRQVRFVQRDVPPNQPRFEPDPIRLPGRPVVFRIEYEALVPIPPPFAFGSGLDHDAGFHRFAHGFERGGRVAELDPKRPGIEFLAQRGDFNRADRDGDLLRPGPMLPPIVRLPARTQQEQHQNHENPVRRDPPAPAGRPPGDFTDERTEEIVQNGRKLSHADNTELFQDSFNPIPPPSRRKLEKFSSRPPGIWLSCFRGHYGKTKLSVRETPEGIGQKSEESGETAAEGRGRAHACGRNRRCRRLPVRADLTAGRKAGDPDAWFVLITTPENRAGCGWGSR